jgi:thymidylate synthase (FAD)
MALSSDQLAAIEEQRSQLKQTRRVTVPALEDVLYDVFPVLDHGFVRVIDYMGSDQSIVQAARVSYGKGTKKVTEDRGLINYLMRHRHTTPFEMCEIKFHIKLPIFVARQWIRHRSANVNEYSARYSILDHEFYLPLQEHVAAQSTINNQGRGAVLNEQESRQVLDLLKRDSEQCYDTYEFLLNDRGDGERRDPERTPLARELARMNLTLNYYTQWYWKIDLHNLMHFLHLRADSHAQMEIRVYADVILSLLEKWVPITYQAFLDYRVKGVSFSEKALQVIQKLVLRKPVSLEDSGLSGREWRELMDTLGLDG